MTSEFIHCVLFTFLSNNLKIKSIVIKIKCILNKNNKQIILSKIKTICIVEQIS